MAMKDYTLPATYRGGVCSICQAAMRPEEPTRICDACGATYHADCWLHNEGCGTYGCKSAPQALKITVSDSPEAGAWGDTKPCPNCGEELIASSLKCPKCKATFDTRAPMSPEDYRAQLARKASERRDTLLASLLLAASALGITAPVTLPLGGFWAVQKRRTARRAADTAQLLLYGSVAVSLAYVGLMVAIFGLNW
jgi:predicted amidophosphoribosyltransferase